MTDEENPIRIKEVARRLGLSTRTIQRWVGQGMPVCKPGRYLYFYWSEIDEWMKNNRKGKDEIE
jgi:excisionase family DNA binding protein